VILSATEFAALRPGIRGILVATSGGFDPLHAGHLRSLAAARALGDALLVIANGDGYLLRKKGYVFMPESDRLEILDALRCVDYVIRYDDGSQVVAGAVEIVRPSIFAKGVTLDDPRELPEWEACRRVGCRVALGVGGPKLRSSSDLAARAGGRRGPGRRARSPKARRQGSAPMGAMRRARARRQGSAPGGAGRRARARRRRRRRSR
jgi:cytidyltransferase-like protein